jgi:hypothetical protein
MGTDTSHQASSPAPIIKEHEGVLVVRDDLYPGGTKARFLGMLFSDVEEVVYASPAERGAHPEHVLGHGDKVMRVRC